MLKINELGDNLPSRKFSRFSKGEGNEITQRAHGELKWISVLGQAQNGLFCEITTRFDGGADSEFEEVILCHVWESKAGFPLSSTTAFFFDISTKLHTFCKVNSIPI